MPFPKAKPLIKTGQGLALQARAIRRLLPAPCRTDSTVLHAEQIFYQLDTCLLDPWLAAEEEPQHLQSFRLLFSHSLQAAF